MIAGNRLSFSKQNSIMQPKDLSRKPTFEEYLRLPENQISIAKGTLIITKEYYPNLDINNYLSQIDAIAKELNISLQDTNDPYRIIEIVNNYLFTIKGYRFNNDSIESFEGTSLNTVLDNTSGTCNGLSCLYLSVAERLELPIYAVLASPSHVFVRYENRDFKLNIETTAKGKIVNDKFYIENFNLTPETIKKHIFLKSLTHKEYLSGVLVSRALAYHNRGEYIKAQRDLELAISLNPKNAAAFYNLGKLYSDKQEFKNALDNYNIAISLFPNYVSAYTNRGVVFSKLTDYDKALQDFNKAISLDPKDSEAYSTRGSCYAYRGEFNKAIEDCSKAILIDPNCVKAYCNRGTAYMSMGDLKKAIIDYNKAISVDPSFAGAYSGRGNFYKEKGLFDKALQDYNKAINLDPKDPGIYYNRGVLYRCLGELDRAIEDYSRAVSLNPKDMQSYFNRGIAYTIRGDVEKAIQDFTITISLNPNIAKAYFIRAMQYNEVKNRDNVLKDLKKAFELDPSLKQQAKEFLGSDKYWIMNDQFNEIIK